MAGWLPVHRAPRERQAAPLRGYKLAHPMVSADGTRAGFGGVTLGRANVYGVVADAECAQGGRHQSPSRWCDCGFYCVHTLNDARALACDPDYRYAVLLEVGASGRFIRYERGLRYARQRVTLVRVGRCGCGHAATVFVETGAGSVGWRRVVAVCPACAGPRPGLPLAGFTRLLGGVPVVQDDTTRPYDPVRPYDLSEENRAATNGSAAATGPAVADGSGPADGSATANGSGPADAPGPADPAVPAPARALDRVAEAELVPVLAAEVALLQARLDEVQRQLVRLTQH